LHYISKTGANIKEKHLSRYFHSVLNQQRFKDFLALRMGKISHTAENTSDEKNKKALPIEFDSSKSL
jgi:AraC-like DNA-binding protein